MKYILYYYPTPVNPNSQTKWVFDSKDELSSFLYTRICSDCKLGEISCDDGTMENLDPGVIDNRDLDGMMCSACGCEWGIFVKEDGEEERSYYEMINNGELI